jgi:hypothetical protein
LRGSAFGEHMKKAILLVALSIIFIFGSKLAAKYGVAYDLKNNPATEHTYPDVKSIKLKWELIEMGLLGLAAVLFVAAPVVYFRDWKKVG